MLPPHANWRKPCVSFPEASISSVSLGEASRLFWHGGELLGQTGGASGLPQVVLRTGIHGGTGTPIRGKPAVGDILRRALPVIVLGARTIDENAGRLAARYGFRGTNGKIGKGRSVGGVVGRELLCPEPPDHEGSNPEHEHSKKRQP